eukprot:jgi/Psemu1/26654/gm1.26654_g
MSTNEYLSSKCTVVVRPSVFIHKVWSAAAEFLPNNLSILFPQEESFTPTKIWCGDFKVTDAFNCAIALQKNTDCTSMVDFFQCTQTWEVNDSSVQYVIPSTLTSAVSDNLVMKLEGSLYLFYHLVGQSESSIMMHMLHRNAILFNHEFPIENCNLTVLSLHTYGRSLIIEGAAMQGFHLPEECFKHVAALQDDFLIG